MEDLQDALEDAQYFNAMHNTVPRPRGRVEYPSSSTLNNWLNNHRTKAMCDVPAICTDNLGFYLFLKFCASKGDLPCILFAEAVARYKAIGTSGARRRAYYEICRDFDLSVTDGGGSEDVAQLYMEASYTLANHSGRIRPITGPNPGSRPDECKESGQDQEPACSGKVEDDENKFVAGAEGANHKSISSTTDFGKLSYPTPIRERRFEFADQGLSRLISETAANLDFDRLGRQFCVPFPEEPDSKHQRRSSNLMQMVGGLSNSNGNSNIGDSKNVDSNKNSSGNTRMSSESKIYPGSEICLKNETSVLAGVNGVSDLALSKNPRLTGKEGLSSKESAPEVQKVLLLGSGLGKIELEEETAEETRSTSSSLASTSTENSLHGNNLLPGTHSLLTQNGSSTVQMHQISSSDASLASAESSASPSMAKTIIQRHFEQVQAEGQRNSLLLRPGSSSVSEDDSLAGTTAATMVAAAAAAYDSCEKIESTSISDTLKSGGVDDGGGGSSSVSVKGARLSDSAPQNSLKMSSLLPIIYPDMLMIRPDGNSSATGESDFDPARNVFDLLEALVFEWLHRKYGALFIDKRCPLYYKWLQVQYIKAQPVSESEFTQLRILGRGGFGLVYGGMRNSTGQLYAMKTMDRKRVKLKNAMDLCWNERDILGRLNSPFIVCLKYAFVSKVELFLVMDLMLGGDLSFWLKQRRFTEEETVYHAGRIFLGIEHMHKHGIAYRDLKPENILMDESGRTCISDLGLACRISPGGTLRGSCGTTGYMAPEMLVRDANNRSRSYTPVVDWFAFGCVLFEMRVGCNPFRTSHARHWAQSFDRRQRREMEGNNNNSSGSNSNKSPPSSGVLIQKHHHQQVQENEQGDRNCSSLTINASCDQLPSRQRNGSSSNKAGGNTKAAGSKVAKGGGTGGNASRKPRQKHCTDLAVMGWDVVFTPEIVSELELKDDFMELCRKLLAKMPMDRLGSRSADDISSHAWFLRCADLEAIRADAIEPPFAPGRDIHTCSQRAIGHFEEDLSKVHLTEEDDEALRSWNFSSSSAFNREIIGVLKQDESLGPVMNEPTARTGCCAGCLIS